jgi:hypothetical protein
VDDDQATRLLERLAADVAVHPAPVADLLRRGRAARRRRRYALAGAAAAGLLVVSGVVGSVVAVGGGDDRGSTSAAAPEDPTGDRRGELPAAGAASCVAEWTEDRPIAEQSVFAFDGVVTGVGPGTTDRPGSGGLDLVGVTFRVAEWFAGGTAPEVTVDMQPPLQPGQGRSDDTVPAFAPGSRLLVSGSPRWGGAPLEDPIAWGCGFTRYYDQGTADAWRTGD